MYFTFLTIQGVLNSAATIRQRQVARISRCCLIVTSSVWSTYRVSQGKLFFLNSLTVNLLICTLTVTGLANFSFTPLLWHPQGPQGCLEQQNYPLSSNLVIWCAKIGLKIKKVWKLSEMTRRTSQNDGILTGFFKFLGFGPNFSAPNYQIQT